MLRIDANSSREIQAVILGLRRATTEIKKQVRQHTKVMAQTEWQKSVREHADSRIEQRVLADTARAYPSNQNVRLSSAGIGKSMTGGAKPSEIYPGVEFGATPQVRSYTATSSRGKQFKVTRNTRQQFRPRSRGYAVIPAARQMIPRIASLWVQTTVRAFHEALEGKG